MQCNHKCPCAPLPQTSVEATPSRLRHPRPSRFSQTKGSPLWNKEVLKNLPRGSCTRPLQRRRKTTEETRTSITNGSPHEHRPQRGAEPTPKPGVGPNTPGGSIPHYEGDPPNRRWARTPPGNIETPFMGPQFPIEEAGKNQTPLKGKPANSHR